MALVAWAPKGYAAPMELLVAKLPPGRVTEREWWEALSDRVSELAVKAGQEETQAAFQALGTPGTARLQEAGQFLVLHNLVLMQELDLHQDSKPFPATVGEPTAEATEALQNVTLMGWVEQALSLVSESSLD